MAQWRKRPVYCQHRTCRAGECGKCEYNPRSGYPVFHLSQYASSGRLRWALIVGIFVYILSWWYRQ